MDKFYIITNSDKDKDFVKRFNLRPEHLKYRELANQETEHK